MPRNVRNVSNGQPTGEATPEILSIGADRFYFPNSNVLEKQQKDLEASSPTYQAALSHIASMNFQAGASGELAKPFGFTVETEGVIDPPVQSATFIADLGQAEGQTFGLVGTVVRGNDPNTGMPVRQETFELLSKPDVVTDPATDIQVVAVFRDGAAFTPGVQGFSILSRFIKCVTGGCASVCLGALTGCAGVFPVYLQCVVVACGGCAVKCGACAACDCSIWCRWAAGCCED
jgi:hypothetical protein